MKIICDCRSENVDIFSVVENTVNNKDKDIRIVEITYICNSCGNMETKTKYLYKPNAKSRRDAESKR